MRNVYDVLVERGFIEQATHESEIRELLGKESVTFYVGFDPTADSLHIGHFIQVIVMMHMQQHGHKPVALVGGGTAKVGDPSGRTDLRQMLTTNQLDINANALGTQLSKYLVLDGEKGFLANNADWLDNLNYIDFLREIGSKFSVNRMLSAECFKQRLEKGLSFLEFNYMIMQGYDFLELYRRFGCKLQLGGNDQWSNIIAGSDLIRRTEEAQAYGLTFKLLTTSAGVKMGKTAKGAVWVDPNKTAPYELFQYFRNVEDADVINCLRLLTFIPMDEVNEFAKLEGADLNQVKELLAFEVTKLVHGEEEAQKSLQTAKEIFTTGVVAADMPSKEIATSEIGEGVGILEMLVKCELTKSNGEGRRLVQQGGISLDGEKITAHDFIITKETFKEGELIIKKGKKIFLKVKLA